MTDLQVSRFWDKYIEKVQSSGVKPGVERWYVKHAESYINSLRHLKLSQHKPGDIEKYIRKIGRSGRFEDWQLKQIVISLKILFNEMVNVPWSESYEWEQWTNQSTSINNHHNTVSRQTETIDIESITNGLMAKSYNNGSFRKIFSLYPQHIHSLIKEIRFRHYSIRTEKTYLDWLLRYIKYHSMKDPENLDSNSISEYLSI